MLSSVLPQKNPMAHENGLSRDSASAGSTWAHMPIITNILTPCGPEGGVALYVFLT